MIKFCNSKTLLGKSIKPYLYSFLLLPIISSATMLINLLVPYVQKSFINKLISNSSQIWWYMVWVLVIMGLSMLLKSFGDYYSNYTSKKINSRMKTLLASKLLNLPQDFFYKHKSNYLTARLEVDTNASSYFYSLEYFKIGISIVSIFGALVIIGLNCWYLIPFVLIGVLIQILIAKLFINNHYKLAKATNEITAENQGILHQYIGNIQTVKVQASEDEACKDISKRYDNAMSLGVKLLKIRLFSNSLFHIVPSLIKVGVVILGIVLYRQKVWNVGDIWATISYVSLAFTPATSLVANRLRREIAQAALDRVEELYAVMPEENLYDGIKLNEKISKLELNNISFAYHGNSEVFKDFSLQASSGEVIAITGKSGAGKSTLMSLILLLYRPQKGDIKFNKIDFKEFNLRDLRSHIGYVSQNPQFFAGTLAENLSKRVSLDEQKLILQKLGLNNLIPKLDEELTEQAMQFSAGERVRLAVARELMQDSDILILDEPTANLDVANREVVMSYILANLQDKIVFIISHDSETVNCCQRKINLGDI